MKSTIFTVWLVVVQGATTNPPTQPSVLIEIWDGGLNSNPKFRTPLFKYLCCVSYLISVLSSVSNFFCFSMFLLIKHLEVLKFLCYWTHVYETSISGTTVMECQRLYVHPKVNLLYWHWTPQRSGHLRSHTGHCCGIPRSVLYAVQYWYIILSRSLEPRSHHPTVQSKYFI